MNYEVNKSTLAIMPIENNKCRVVEKDNEYYIPMNTFEVIEHSCEYFGSSYKGRYTGTNVITGSKYKTPILIEESEELIFFPTHSPRKKECIWISLDNIRKYYKGKFPNTTIIEFKTNDKLEVNVSYNIINNQILKSTRLKLLIKERLEKNKNML